MLKPAFIANAFTKLFPCQKEIQKSAPALPYGLFDPKWYSAAYCLNTSADALWEEYCCDGAFAGRNPNRLFDSSWYLRKHPGLLQCRLNPLLHYAQEGWVKGYDPHPLFATTWYLETYRDVACSGLNALAHYLLYGHTEHRSPSPYFDAAWYIKQYPEVESSSIDALSHFLREGNSGKYNPNPFFDSAWYLETYPHVRSSGVNPLNHFVDIGQDMGFAPNPFLDSEWYRKENLERENCNGKWFYHFIETARKEERYPCAAPYHFADMDSLARCLSSLPVSRTPLTCSAFLKLSKIVDMRKPDNGLMDDVVVYRSSNFPQGSAAKTAFPAKPYVAELKDVNILAGTRYVFTKNLALHDEETHFYNVQGAALKYLRAKRIGGGWINIRFDIRQAAWIDQGINIMHEYSTNYFHFITETIPRILLSEEANIPLNVPFLVEDGLHQNIGHLLDAVNSARRPIQLLTPDTLYNVKTLYMPSDLTTVVDAYEPGPATTLTTLDIERIKAGAERCKAILLRDPGTRTRRKIFAARTGDRRTLLNQAAIEALLIEKGFETVFADTLTLAEQIKVFGEADMVIGPTGAQMTNMIWCGEGTEVIILASDHPSHQLYFWQLLGRVPNASVRIIQGPRAYNKMDKYSVHDDYSIDPSDIIDLL